ncbi:RNA 2',3'-cyclic phosphodiesterase [Lacticigenium naphthae]|uniref:RNA 2',3'-cyclic phosphodiesterase n=1 Tax=Lacticigenium naphthae TaxID=515351 RepID=UPI00041FAF34|nr:RNA 2',3'-cyclic phosphodiesterase [Lacticigenium naphthae]
MRVFIAVEIEERTKKQLKGIQNNIKKYVEKGNYTSRDNFHVTLRFIGEVDKEEISRLKQVIDRTASNGTSFTISLDTVGHFPRKKKEIIWVGVKGQLDCLKDLKISIEDKLDKVGFDKEGLEYIPHITMVRQAVLNIPVESLIDKIKVPDAEIVVNSISLMESVRLDNELVYRLIYIKSF